jgi:YVTN family beta-propeller protein
VLVSKLRGLLAEQGIDGASALTGAFGCYRLQLPEGTWVDVLAATSALQAAEDALAVGDPERAKQAATLAFSLVRQPFLPGDDGAWIEEKRRELGAIRARALSVLADAALRAGAARDAAKWAEQSIALEPFREGGYRRLMEAHAAAGDRAEALRVYERCRRLLAEKLGAYPSPETESLYRRLLEAPAIHAEAVPAAKAPRREAPEPMPEPARRASRHARLWATAAVAAAGAAVAGAALVAARGDATHANALGNSIVQLDSSGSIAASVPVGTRPVALTTAAGSLWVANLDDRTVTRVNATSRRVLRTISIPAAPSALAVTKSGVWVSDGAGDVARIDPSYDRLAFSQRLASASSGFYGTLAPRPLLTAFGSLWIVDPDGYVSRVDPSSARRTRSVDTGDDPAAIAAGAGSIWVANRSDGTVTRIDPETLLATTIPVGHGPDAIAVNAAGAWVANGGDNTVVRVDPETNLVASAIAVGDTPVAVLATANALWVANADEETVLRLDPATGRVKRKVRLARTPDALAAIAGRVWVAVAPPPPPSPAAGGVAHVTLESDLPSYDPALDVIPQFLYATCANLVTYPDKPARRGSSRRLPKRFPCRRMAGGRIPSGSGPASAFLRRPTSR